MDPAVIAKAKLNPTLVFHHPSELMHADLSVDDKEIILKQWAYDLEEELQAAEENMPECASDDVDTRADVLQAIHEVAIKLGVALGNDDAS